MSFLLAECKELDFGELLAVNGGCSGGMSCSGGSSGSSSRSTEHSIGTSITYSGSNNKSVSCGGSVIVTPTRPVSCSGSVTTKQTPDNKNDYHCDIIAFNTAIDNGVTNPGVWDGNSLTVNQIFNKNYQNKSRDSMSGKSKGYVFFDFDGNGTYDHMEYYEANGNGTYTCWETDGKSNPSKRTYTWSKDKNGKGGSSTTATFVRLQ